MSHDKTTVLQLGGSPVAQHYYLSVIRATRIINQRGQLFTQIVDIDTT